MTEDNSPDADNLVTRVVEGFERMHVPPAPGAAQTAQWLERAEAHGSRSPLAMRLARLSTGQRIAACSLGISVLVGVVMLLAFGLGKPLSAMERMVRQLREVESYTYVMSTTATEVEDGGNRTTTWKSKAPNYWQAPSASRSEFRAVKTEKPSRAGQPAGELVEDFAEIYPAGKLNGSPATTAKYQLGIFVDHKRKTFRRLPFEPIGSPTYPLDLLRMIREHLGEVTRDLGSKQIDGRKARGYAMTFKKTRESRPKPPMDVWVDAETDLPIEFGYKSKNGAFRVAEFRWNIELDPKLFEPTPPQGYDDITPPENECDLAEVAAALKLYARLGGGHYPRGVTFVAADIHQEMLKAAGFAGTPQPAWSRDKKFLEIERSRRGLDWIERILRNLHHAAYDGGHVGPQDKGKLLLWWRIWGPQRYRVFYGDLRSEILTPAQAARLGLTDSSPD